MRLTPGPTWAAAPHILSTGTSQTLSPTIARPSALMPLTQGPTLGAAPLILKQGTSKARSRISPRPSGSTRSTLPHTKAAPMTTPGRATGTRR